MKYVILTVISVIIILSTTIHSLANERTYLLVVMISDPIQLEKLINLQIKVVDRLVGFCIAICDTEQLRVLTQYGYVYQILDEHPEEKEYFLVCYRTSEQLQIIKRYGDILWYDGNIAIVRIEISVAERLPAYGLEIKRLNRDMIRLPSVRFKRPTVSAQIEAYIQTMVSQISESDIEGYIQSLQDFGTRYSYAPGCSLSAEYLYTQLQQMGLTVEFDEYTYQGMYNWRNVVATLEGITNPDSIFIICAHYDCVSESPFISAPGADDNASGTAAVLEVASVLSQYQFDYTIKFVLFSGEEQGLIGSEHFAAEAAAAGWKIGGVLNFDMIGYTDDEYLDLNIISDYYSHELAELMAYSSQCYTQLISYVSHEPSTPSDHYPFWLHGYYAIFSIEHVEDHWNPYYHKTSDKLETLNLTFLTQVTKSAIGCIAMLSSPVFTGFCGRVTDVATGEGIENARVIFTYPRGDTVYTDPAGYYSSNQLIAGEYSLYAHADGYQATPSKDYLLSSKEIIVSNFGLIPIGISSPILYIEDIQLFDLGDGDGIIDAGENIELKITLKNYGNRIAREVEAVLYSDDRWVEIGDSIEYYPDINIDSVGTCLDDYNFIVNDSCGAAYQLEFTLSIRAMGGYQSLDSLYFYVSVAQSGWPVPTGMISYSSPTLADLNNDGSQEVAICTMDGKVWLLHHTGEPVEGWPIQIDSTVSSCAIGDIDLDGEMEIVVTAGDGKVYVWSDTGELLPNWPQYVGERVFASPVLIDLDNDKDLEIIVCTHLTGNIYIFHHDGTLLEGWPVAIGDTVFVSPAVGDLDKDDNIEIVTGNFRYRGGYFYEGDMYVLHSDGSVMQGWPKPITGIFSSPALADLDNDDDLEIIAGLFDGWVYVWHHTGSLVKGWPRLSGSFTFLPVLSSPAIADLDDDGTLEVIVGTYSGTVKAWHADGTIVPGFPVFMGGYHFWGFWNPIRSSPAIGDITGDGKDDIVIGTPDSRVFVWQSDGTLASDWVLGTRGTVNSSPALGDLDQDGDIEILVGSHDGNLYAWDCLAAYHPENIQWGCFRHDRWHTGCYGYPTVGITVKEFTAIPQTNRITIYWQLNNTSRILGCNVYRSTTADASTKQKINAQPIKTNSYTDYNVKCGGVYYYWLELIESTTYRSELFGPVSVAMSIPFGTIFSLSQNYPNPVNSTCGIYYSIPSTEVVSLTIYNINGQLVRTLIDKPHTPSCYRINFDGTAGTSKRLSSGVYFYRLTQSDDYTALKKMVFLR